VPGNVGRHIGQKCGQLAEFVVAVVEAGNEQGDDLQPHAHLVQTADGVEDRLQASAEFAIVAIIEALEVHLVEIDPGMEILEHLRRAVAVRNKRGVSKPAWRAWRKTATAHSLVISGSL
jgi:hypothetical protein